MCAEAEKHGFDQIDSSINLGPGLNEPKLQSFQYIYNGSFSLSLSLFLQCHKLQEDTCKRSRMGDNYNSKSLTEQNTRLAFLLRQLIVSD